MPTFLPMNDLSGSITLILPCHAVAKSELWQTWQAPSSTKILHCLQTRFIFLSSPSSRLAFPFPSSRLAFPLLFLPCCPALQHPPQSTQACLFQAASW